MPLKLFVALAFLFLGVCFEGNAQSGYTLEIRTIPANVSLQNRFKLDASYPDSSSAIRKVMNVLAMIRKNGYLLADTQSVERNGKALKAHIHLGQQFKDLNLSLKNVPPAILHKAGFPTGFLKIDNADSGVLNDVLEQLLDAYEDSGYPFAILSLDSLEVLNDGITAKVQTSSGDYFEFDSLKVAGDVNISSAFLESYLDIKHGYQYSGTSVSEIESRLTDLPFIRSVKGPSITFSGNKAVVVIYLEKQNSNQFDGMLGFLPGNSSGKIQITGDLKLHIDNVFKRAETFDFNFKGLPDKSKELNFSLGLSELLSSPLGIDFRFNLFRQDTDFQNIAYRSTLKYRIPKGNFSVFVNSRSGLPIAADSINTDQFSIAKLSYLSFGMGFLRKTLNSRLFPSKGHWIEINAEAGKKKLLDTAARTTEQAGRTRIAQYRWLSSAEFYFRLSLHGVLKLSNQSGLLIGKDLFDNELYRLGGFNNLRGFNEQSILANNYSIMNAEYRLQIERASYLFVFANQGFVQRRTIKQNIQDTPLGFGAGINLQVKTGIFSLSYALGKAKDIPLNLQDGKIHFGLVTLF